MFDNIHTSYLMENLWYICSYTSVYIDLPPSPLYSILQSRIILLKRLMIKLIIHVVIVHNFLSTSNTRTLPFIYFLFTLAKRRSFIQVSHASILQFTEC